MIPSYPYTNESLDAVVKGLDVNSSDDIIAVCGSGDQAFAMLEYANSVLAIDSDINQVEYANKRAVMIKEGSFEKMFEAAPRYLCQCKNEIDNKKRSIAYFMQPGRLQRIRRKIGSLEIRLVSRNFAEGIGESIFSKAYLSNIIGFEGFMAEPQPQAGFIKEIARRLRMPGLIYFATQGSLRFGEIQTLGKDETLSRTARNEEDKIHGAGRGWNAAVFRRRE